MRVPLPHWRSLPRKSGATLAAAALIGAAMTVLSGPAGALAASVVTTADDGAVVVHTAPSALWVQATVRAPEADGGAVLAQTDHLVAGNDGWRSEAPIHLPDGSAYGDYPVDVDYRLPDGPVQHVAAAGLFSYRRHAGIATAAFDRAVTDFDHQTATLSGSVTVYDPVTQTSAPAGAGVTVHVAATVHSGASITKPLSADAVTDDSGAFSLAIKPGGSLAQGTAQVVIGPADSLTTTATAPVALPDVGTSGMAVRITGGPERARVHAGHTFHVTGTVQRLTTADGWQPLAGVTVVTASGDVDYWNYTTPGLMGSGVSDASGHFSYYVTATRTTSFGTHARFSDYVGQDVIGGTVFVPVRASYSTPTFSIDAYRGVRASSYLRGPCGHQAIQLQYSRNGHTGWTRIGGAYSADKYGTSSCKVTVTGYGATDGYYRITHAESDELLAFASGARRMHRIPTKTTFSISPSRPYKDAPMTASGQVVQAVNGKWLGLRHARVVLVYRPKGDSSWYWVSKGWTTSSGHFSLKGKAYGDGYWGVYYQADAAHFYSQTKPRYVNVR